MAHRPIWQTKQAHFGLALLISTIISCGLFAYSSQRSHSLHYSYLVWNLFLASMPLVLATVLVRSLRHRRWSDWQPISWSLLWLLFVPNSFYMVSDYIHLRDIASDQILYDAVMFTAFILQALLLGFASLYLVHHELRKRLSSFGTASIVGVVLLVSSFAIYIGRDLRWNSWDVIINPGGLLFDISDRVIKPQAYSDMLLTTSSFFILLASTYGLIWTAARWLRQTAAREALQQLQDVSRRA